MGTTITFRVDDELRRDLEERASRLGKSLSETVRDILATAVAREPIGERAAHLRGRLRLPRTNSEPWRRQLRERNWRP